ncbi:MAG: YigZ family protein [Firmicutes bacterium]|nr:YigZ family protein [Bacillota bacterium]
MSRSYFTLATAGEAVFEEKKSRFIGWAAPVEDEKQAQAYLSQRRALHREAKHHVYAWMIGEDDRFQRSSDDGEPAGTGGRPVLEALKQKGLKNVMVVVSRYFGGVLLGAGGLTRAYSRSAHMALAAAPAVENIPGSLCALRFEYPYLGRVESWLKANALPVRDKNFSQDICFFCLIPQAELDERRRQLTDISDGSAHWQVLDENIWLSRPRENR